jgi:hypothetical protein
MTTRDNVSIIATTLALLLLLRVPAGAGDPAQGDRLFRITRNKNNNIVCYDVQLKDGKLDDSVPVSVYWIIPSENNKLEGLNFIERTKAYGVSIEKAYGRDSVDIRLKAGKGVLRVTTRGSRWVALATVDSREVALDSVFVMAEESGFTPTVKWVEVFGHDPATGESVRQKILK